MIYCYITYNVYVSMCLISQKGIEVLITNKIYNKYIITIYIYYIII